MEDKLSRVSNLFDKKVMVRASVLFVLSLIFITIVPSRVITIRDYLLLKNKIKTITSDSSQIVESLPSAKEVYTIFEDLGFGIEVCGVIDYVDGKPKVIGYYGEDLEVSDSRTIEFIVSNDENIDYKFAQLSSYGLAFESIHLDSEDSNISIKIFCK